MHRLAGKRRSFLFSSIAGLLLIPVSGALALDSTVPVNSSVFPLVVKGEQAPGLIGVNPLRVSAFACPEGRAKP
ncbi:MAG: hypothetical protein AB1405_12930, partial [Bdellovibrionota bacterium]